MNNVTQNSRRLAESLLDHALAMVPPCLMPEKHVNEQTGDVKVSFFAHGLYSFFGAIYDYEQEPYLWISIGLTNLNGIDKVAVYEDVLEKNERIGAPFRFALENEILTVVLRVPASKIPPAYLKHLILTSADFAHYAFEQIREKFPALQPLAQQATAVQHTLN